MSIPRPIASKLISIEDLAVVRRRLRSSGKKVAFTNGCFDLLHSGHILTINKAKEAGDVLIVAINSDESVHRIKGYGRPVIPENERREILAAMSAVDYVIVFDEPDPERIIGLILPDALVKGGDWGENEIVGRETVERNGGIVVRVPPLKGRSSTNIISKILNAPALRRN
jgi:rfaE bifunctional protein nucleotidyltransferase chain/domain